jgi:hypothetical protein
MNMNQNERLQCKVKERNAIQQNDKEKMRILNDLLSLRFLEGMTCI